MFFSATVDNGFVKNKKTNIMENNATLGSIQPASIPAISGIIRSCIASYNGSSPKQPVRMADMRDVEQNALEKVWKHKDLFDPTRASLATWVWHIAFRCISDYCVSKGKYIIWEPKQEESEYDLADEFDFESAIFSQEEVKWLDEHINRLPERRRFVVEATRKGKKSEEIARELGCTKDAVYNLYNKAREALIEMRRAEDPTAA